MSLSTTGNSGLFTETEFQNRGVIKLAPDILVYIGGSLQTQVIAPVTSSGSSRDLSFNDGITSVNISHTVERGGGGTANIDIAAPIYNEKSNYWVPFRTDVGQVVRMPVFVPMMEVKIYARGRFMVKDSPRYYPIFWGFITHVEESYSGGLWKISLQCADFLHWWSYMTVTIHPSVESHVASGGRESLTPYATIFKTKNPFDIIYALFESMGYHDFVAATWVGQLTPLGTIYPIKMYQKTVNGIMEYWNSRFGHLGNLLKMYGLGGRLIPITAKDGQKLMSREPNAPDKVQNTKKSRSQASTVPREERSFKIDDLIKHFMPFGEFATMDVPNTAETQTKLDFAMEMANRIEYEFYQDVNGNFIFKPPFYNMDVRGLLPYEVNPSDILNYSVSQDTEGIVTALQVATSFHEKILAQTGSEAPMGQGYHIDIDLAKRYGFRHRNMAIQYIVDRNLARQMAVAQMNKINAKTMVGTITMPGRPEMRLGYPIYLTHRDTFHYVKSIGHTFDFGGSFTTQLGLETERKKVFELKDDTWSEEPMRDMIYEYSGQFYVPPEIGPGPSKENEKDPDEIQKTILQSAEGRIAASQMGRYDLVVRKDETQKSITGTTLPFTDEDGYKLIGAFPYGRGVNPRDVDNTEPYRYKEEAFMVTSIGIGSLDEAKRMGLIFPDVNFSAERLNNGEGKELSVAQFLLTSDITSKEGSDAPAPIAENQTTSSLGNVPQPPAGTNNTGQPVTDKVTTTKPRQSSTPAAAPGTSRLVDNVKPIIRGTRQEYRQE